jgi:membrane protein
LEPVVTKKARFRGAKGLAERVWVGARSSGERFSDADGPRLAASMSYYAVFSLFPLLLVLGALAEYALGDSQALRERVLRWAAGAGSTGTRRVFEEALASVAARAPSPVAGIGLGAIAALLGASGVFIELDTALGRIFRVRAKKRNFLESVRDLVLDRLWGFLLVVATSAALLVTTLARGALELPSTIPGADELGSAASLIIGGSALTASIALCYRVLPETRVPWKSAWKGALVASLLLHVIREPFAWFVVNLTSYAAYGLMGAILGILTWFQVAACILLFGACVSAVSAELTGQKRAPDTHVSTAAGA